MGNGRRVFLGAFPPTGLCGSCSASRHGCVESAAASSVATAASMPFMPRERAVSEMFSLEGVGVSLGGRESGWGVGVEGGLL